MPNGETRKFTIERRTTSGPYMGPGRFAAAPLAATGIERTLGQSAKHADRLTQIANKVYLEARALAPAIRLIPGIGPVMSGATIAAGRGMAVAVGELKTTNFKQLGGIRDILGGTQALFHNFGQFFKTPPASWSQRLFRPLASNFQQIGGGIGQVAGLLLKVIPIAVVVGAGVMAILSISKLFRSWMGSIFGLVSLMMDILIVPFMPLFQWVIHFLMGTVLPWVQGVAAWLNKVDMSGLIAWLGGVLDKGFKFVTVTIPEWWNAAVAWFSTYLKEPLAGLWDAIKGVDWTGILGTISGAVVSMATGVARFMGFVGPSGMLDVGIGAIAGAVLGAFFGHPFLGALAGTFAGALVAALNAWLAPKVDQWAESFWTSGLGKWLIPKLWGIATLPGKQMGMPYVPRTMPVMVHAGESIVPANIRPYLGATFNNYFILGTPGTSGGIEQTIGTNFEQILRRVLS